MNSDIGSPSGELSLASKLQGQHGSALKKNGIDTTAPPTISVTAPPNMTILYYSFCFYYI